MTATSSNRDAAGGERPDGSLAAIVLTAGRHGREPTRREHHALRPGSIASLVARAPAASRSAAVGGLVAALVVHGALAGAIGTAAVDTRSPAAAPADPIEVAHVVELDPPPVPEPVEAPQPEPPPAPAKAPEPTPEPSPATPPDAPAPDAPPPDTPPPPSAEPADAPPSPAQAGEVLAAAAPADPVDFTGFDMVTGTGERYAGGATSRSGRSEQAVYGAVDPDSAPGSGAASRNAPSKARPVSLPDNSWSDCPWPSEASSLRIDEQTVMLRAVVDERGRAVSVTVLADPGHGFGAQAKTCALDSRWNEARDERGDPYTATSPPIRVRFTR